MNILLIDDDKAAMQYYIRALQKADFTLVHTRNPDAALQALEAKGDNFDLIILDSAMPSGKTFAAQATDAGTLTGDFLFKTIREKWPRIPIVILTNFYGLEWIQAAMGSSNVTADRKINVTPNKLVEVVKKMIREGINSTYGEPNNHFTELKIQKF